MNLAILRLMTNGSNQSQALFRVRVEDGEDIKVLSAMLQDSIVAVSDLCYLPEERRFVMVANRFRWEKKCATDDTACQERILCGVNFCNVTAVQLKQVDLKLREAVLDLLAVVQPDAHTVELVFAGDRSIRLQMEKLCCLAEDFGEAWPTQYCPNHEDAETA